MNKHVNVNNVNSFSAMISSESFNACQPILQLSSLLFMNVFMLIPGLNLSFTHLILPCMTLFVTRHASYLRDRSICGEGETFRTPSSSEGIDICVCFSFV